MKPTDPVQQHNPLVEREPDPSPCNDPVAPLLATQRNSRSRLRVFALAGVVSLVIFGTWGGRELWAGWHEKSARHSFENEDYEEALRHIDNALQVRSGRFSTNFMAARIDRARRAYPEAEKYLLRCKEIDGMTPPLQMEWLLLRCEKGDVDELAPELLAAVDQNHPESPAILEAMALVYMRQTRYPQALATLNKWLERTPDSPRALDWRGWVGNQMDRRGQAIDDYTRVLELQPDRPGVRLRLAQLLVESSRHVEALPHLEKLRLTQPTNPDVIVGLASCYVVQLRRDEARKLLDELLSEHPNHFGALLSSGNLEREDGNYVEAERKLRKATELKPLDPTARYSLHLTLLAQPDHQKEAEEERIRWERDKDSISRLTRLLRGELSEKPNDPNLAAEAGELLLKQGEDQRALFWLNRALQIDPRHQQTHKILTSYYERINNQTLAETHRQQSGKVLGK